MRLDDLMLGVPRKVREDRFAGVLLWTVAGLTVALLAWASLARVDQVVRGTGRVVPAGRLQLISNLEGGTVAAILVQPGQRVKRGEVLVRLDPVARGAALAESDASLDALETRAARLSAEASGGVPAFPAAGIDPGLIAQERALFAASRSALAAERDIAAARLQQAERTAAQAEAEARARQEALVLAREEAAVTRPLVEKGVESRMALSRAESAERQAEAQVQAALAAVRRAGAVRAEAVSALAAVERRFRSEAADALAETRAQLSARRQAVPALADRVARSDLRSPVDGSVNRVLVTTIGGTVAPGAPLVEVVPLNDALVVEAAISPSDIAWVRPGQKANIKITSYDYSIYGTLPGVVETVAPDATTEERSGQTYFSVRVRMAARSLRGEGGSRLPVSAGMMAEVDLLGPSRTVLEYLLTPVRRISREAFRES